MKNNYKIRETKPSDVDFLIKWLMEPGVLRWFPMSNLREVEDAARVWVAYSKIGAALTAEIDGTPCGMANLYIQPFVKLKHQCLFAIIMEGNYRGKGWGTKLLDALIKLAKETFHIELLHLEVYAENPAISLYKRIGFVEYGQHEKFLKEDGRYRTKILMQKIL